MGIILKPCPFCGGKAEIKRIQSNNKDNVFITCKDCGSATAIYSISSNVIPRRVKSDDKVFNPVVNAWNRRTGE